MKPAQSTSNPRLHWVYFGLGLALIVAVYSLYGMNIVGWRNSHDLGWRFMTNSGVNVVSEVFGVGERGGLLVGDRIIAINGQTYSTYDELRRLRNSEPGSVNSYTIERDGKTIELSITTGRLGLRAAFTRSGPIFLIGLIYVFIGVLVFLMKPSAAESWLFFVMACFLGAEISYAGPSGMMHPAWLYDIERILDTFLPAPVIHLALKFPKTRTFVRRRPWLITIPYLVSLVLFVSFKVTTSSYYDPSPLLDLFWVAFVMSGVLVFLAALLWNFLRDPSIVVRLQSQVIFIGILFGFFVPVVDLVLRTTSKGYLFSDPTIGFAIFLTMFPLSIAYTIVKHDLFAIDVIVRRTYGYVLSTATILGVYGLIVLILDLTLHSSELSSSRAFSVVFALTVVFFFKPLHERIQRFVDRVFYRQKYDYRKTIKDTSEAMIRILDADEIYKTLIGSVVREMFLENGLLLLPDHESHAYRVRIVEGDDGKNSGTNGISENDALTRLLQERKDAIFRYEADLNPAYEPYREQLKETFGAFASDLMLPLMYKDEMRGIISLGRKKSGKMFTREDLDLLKTITNQSAIALENAKLFEENIEKTRMEEELAIARDLQMSMLPATCPQIQGFEIAAMSTPAREVGGDFYDFIETGNNGLGLVVGDVTGKSVSGALVVAASRSIFRMLSEQELNVSEMMIRANHRIKKDIKSGMFVALLYALVEPNSRTLRLSSAGQTLPVHFCVEKGQARLVETEGDNFPLGILEEAEYAETRLQLARGDAVVFYTDGIVEAMNEQNEIFGFDRLLQVIEGSPSMTADSILKEIIERVLEFAGSAPQHDDLTVIVLRAVS